MSFEERKRRWVALEDMTSPVNRLLVVDCAEGMPDRPMLWWENAREREEWSYARYQRLCENAEIIADDTVPSLNLLTGTEIFAEAFGCRVHRPLDNNPFALPCITDASQVAGVKIPKLEDTRLVTLFEMADRLRERAGADALLGMPDIQTPTDIAALIWDKNSFYPAMLEEPEAVLELCHKVRDFLFLFFDTWFDRYGREFMAHYPDYYMPCGISMSEDEIGAVSPSMFDTFFKEDLEAFSHRYGGIGIHCCADSMHQWGRLREIPQLRLINLVRDRAQTKRSLSFFRNVCAQYPADALCPLDGIREPEALHLVRAVSVQTVEQARRAVDAFRDGTLS